MNSKIVFGILALALLAVGCISEFDAKLPQSDEQILIVDGNIVENTDAIFHLSKSFPMDSTFNWNMLNINATLTLIGSNGYQSAPATNMGKGTYRIPIGNLDDDVAYGIRIEYNGDTYQSALSKPLRTPEIDSISWTQPERNGTISFQVSTHDDPEGAKFFIWDYTENWEIMAYYFTTIFFNPIDSVFYEDYTAPTFYCWKSAASTGEFIIGSTESLSENRIINKQFSQFDSRDNRFSRLYCVTVNQRAISKSAYEYYQNKITLNEGMGGLFTPQPSELSGNITCITNPSKKAMGFVETSKNTTQKRVFVSSTQITRPVLPSNCELMTQGDMIGYMGENNILTYNEVYAWGFRPAGFRGENPEIILPTAWSSAPCTDCVANGGTKNKPDFWPNDDK